MSEMLLLRAQRWESALGLDRFDSLVFQVVLSGNLAAQPVRPGEAAGLLSLREGRRAISAMAVARSMGLPYETVRRRMSPLVAADRLERAQDGFVVPPALFESGAGAGLAAADHAALGATIAALAADGDVAPVMLDRVPADLVARVQLDFAIRALEGFADLHGDLVSGLVVVTIVAANVRHLLGDAELSRRYAASDSPPPDALRRPIALRTLARELALPFETVRRRVAALVERDMVVLSGEGAIVPRHVLLLPEQRRNTRRVVGQFERMLELLARCAEVS